VCVCVGLLHEGCPHCNASWTSSSGDKLFLLFTGQEVVLYAGVACTSQFPPPRSGWLVLTAVGPSLFFVCFFFCFSFSLSFFPGLCCALMRTLMCHVFHAAECTSRIKRFLTTVSPSPRLLVVRGGTRAATVWFQSRLVEDPHARASTAASDTRGSGRSSNTNGDAAPTSSILATDESPAGADNKRWRFEEAGDFAMAGIEQFVTQAVRDAARNVL